MSDFILEEQLENVVNPSTKEHLKEVLSCYYNKNYRACVVVLYTTVIFDLMQKVKILKEIYNDSEAEEIIQEIKNSQEKNKKSPQWEENLIQKIYDKTKLISIIEKDELLYLKSQRNYAAHPIINLENEINSEKIELNNISKETASDLIRKAFEIVFLKDTILAKDLNIEIIKDSNEYYSRLGIDGLDEFLNNKYFKRMTQERKNSLFKTLWKFTFHIDNESCTNNRISNLNTLGLLYKENKSIYKDLIEKDIDFYSIINFENIEKLTEKLEKDIDISDIIIFKNHKNLIFIKFIENNPEIYKLLNNHFKNIIAQTVNHFYIKKDVLNDTSTDSNKLLFQEQVLLKSTAMFLSENSQEHFKNVLTMISNLQIIRHDWTDFGLYDILKEEHFKLLFNQSEYKGNKQDFIDFLIKYCMGACNFYQASNLFENLMEYDKYFNEKDYYYILKKMNHNYQFYANNEKDNFISKLKESYRSKYKNDILVSKEELFLFDNLRKEPIKIEDCNIEIFMKLFSDYAHYYSAFELYSVFVRITSKYIQNHKSADFPNILNIIQNDTNYLDAFENLFKNE